MGTNSMRKYPLAFPQATAASLAPSTVDSTSTLEQHNRIKFPSFLLPFTKLSNLLKLVGLYGKQFEEKKEFTVRN